MVWIKHQDQLLYVYAFSKMTPFFLLSLCFIGWEIGALPLFFLLFIFSFEGFYGLIDKVYATDGI